MALFMHAPEGFHQAIQTANSLPTPFFSTLCYDVVLFLSGKIGFCSASRYMKLKESLSVPVDDHSLQNLINAITYIYRYAISEKLDAENLYKKLTESILGSQSTSDTIAKLWNEKHWKMASQQQTDYLHVGKLVDMKWKLAFATCSNTCPKMNTAFITLSLAIARPDGIIVRRCYELELAEFKDFANRIKEIGNMIEDM